MERKELIKKLEIKNNENGEGKNFQLEYYLTNVKDGMYGIEISKITNNSNNEIKSMSNICSTKEQTIELLEKLVRNQVTPITFTYIVEDFLGTL